MKKIILTAIAAVAVLAVACQPKSAPDSQNEVYIPEKTEPMELTKFETIKLQQPNTKGGDALLRTMQNRHTSREFKTDNLSLKHLSEVLWAANGINRPQESKRTIPSAMAVYPYDVYAVLANGIYRYDPAAHELIPVVEGDHRGLAGMQPFVADAPLNLVLVADYGRYNEDFPRDKTSQCAYLDAGHSVQNVYLYCASEGLNVVERGSIDGDTFLRQIGLDGTNHEVLIAQTVGY